MRRATSGEVHLAWARDKDGRKVHAGALDPKHRRTRAPFTCPGCGDVVVPHLGEVRRRHFAHHPGSRCPLTAPETALHLNAKERLLWLAEEAFAGRRAVTLLTRCPACRRLAPRPLDGFGTAAVAEGAVGPLRADVLVLAGEAPALAIEVKVTHAVDPEKEAALAAAGVPAVELDAREEWERSSGDVGGGSLSELRGDSLSPSSAEAFGQDGAGGEGQGEGGNRSTGIATEIVLLRTLGFPPCPACAAQARAADDLDRGGEAAAIAELERLRALGLLGPRPSGSADSGAPLSEGDRERLRTWFRCPECGDRALALGSRLARHACPGAEPRPVAWKGYDGALVELAWWRRAEKP